MSRSEGNALLMLVSIPLALSVLGEERFGVYGVVQTLMWFMNLWLAGSMFLAMLVVNMPERCREGYQEIHVGKALGVTQNVVAAGLLFFGAHHWPTVTFLLLAIYGVQAVAMTVNAAHLVWHRPWLLPGWSKMETGLAQRVIGEGLTLFVAGSMAPFLQREGTKWKVGQMDGPAAVGRHTILIQPGFFLYGFVFMPSRPLWPAMADAVARGHMAWVRAARGHMLRFVFPLATTTVLGFTLCGSWLADHWLHAYVELQCSDFTLFSLSFVLVVWPHLHYVVPAGRGVMRRPAMVLTLETVAVLALAWVGMRHFEFSGALAAAGGGVLLCSASWLPLLPGRRLSASPDAPGPKTAPVPWPRAAATPLSLPA